MSNDDNREQGGSNQGKVGYKRPPNASQFKPGQSGNPKGRPRSCREIDRDLRELDFGMVTVRIDKRAYKVPRIVALSALLNKEVLKYTSTTRN